MTWEKELAAGTVRLEIKHVYCSNSLFFGINIMVERRIRLSEKFCEVKLFYKLTIIFNTRYTIGNTFPDLDKRNMENTFLRQKWKNDIC